MPHLLLFDGLDNVGKLFNGLPFLHSNENGQL